MPSLTCYRLRSHIAGNPVTDLHQAVDAGALSHLFAQGAVSAELLQMNAEFRQRAHERVMEFTGDLSGFDFFDTDAFRPSEFRVVYSVMAPWAGRDPADAFPFFAKVNLRNVVEQLRSRGFNVGLRPVDTAA